MRKPLTLVAENLQPWPGLQQHLLTQLTFCNIRTHLNALLGGWPLGWLSSRQRDSCSRSKAWQL